MDTLIELIVRGLIALFSGGSGQRPTPLPPPRQAPTAPPGQQQQWPQQQRPPQQRPQQGRPQAVRRGPVRQQPAARQQPGVRRGPANVAMKRKAGPPPVPQAAPGSVAMRANAAAKPQAAAQVAPAPQPAITAPAIRQLIMSRRSAMRTIYVLSEVVGPPLGLRDE